ncbi:MAG TPA: M20/M25/M40 family metallo-hydrolase [Galbitalea sp.]|nr:M20/M25/M40 family metallo-hydrolase [Galbitalea sp.]
MTPVERFRALLRIPTISRIELDRVDWQQFERFVTLIPELYPGVHKTLEREIVAEHSLLYRWPGASPANPIVLMAHYDVVDATDERWEHPPFAADLVGDGPDTELWARGSLDDKGALVCILEAVEALVARGFTPTNDVYLSFGHDEETIGSGATAIAVLLKSRDIRPALVLDEGGAIVEGIFPGVADPIAVIGVSEKGITSVELRVTQDGGHASTPPTLAATTRLARAIDRLDRRPFPARFSATSLEMIRTIGRRARQPYRWLFTTQWLTRGILLALFRRLNDETRAMIRTTGVVTRLNGSLADNALAETATAIVNVRVAVGSSVDAAVAHVRDAIRDPLVQVTALHPSEPSPVSPTTGPQWERVRDAIAAVHPEAIVTPYIQLGASDSRHFTGICNAVYRFTPFEMSLAERGTLHAVNERIHVDTWLAGIAFYEALIEGTA